MAAQEAEAGAGKNNAFFEEEEGFPFCDQRMACAHCELPGECGSRGSSQLAASRRPWSQLTGREREEDREREKERDRETETESVAIVGFDFHECVNDSFRSFSLFVMSVTF